MSVITRIELLVRPSNATEEKALRQLIGSCVKLASTEPVIQQTIQLRQQHRIKLPDAIIAATALTHSLPLVTRNESDFQRIAGLILINPHDSAQLPVR